MQSWDDYQRIKRRTDEALGVLDAINADPGKRLPALAVKATFLPVESDRPPRHIEALDEALAKAAREAWPQLAARAAAILTADRDAACLACKAELEAALGKIRDLEQGEAQ